MVRQLPPNELGLPLEIYCFSAEKEWVKYEKVQSDIFDHVMAMLDLFDLRAYQRDGHLSLLAHREHSAYQQEAKVNARQGADNSAKQSTSESSDGSADERTERSVNTPAEPHSTPKA